MRARFLFIALLALPFVAATARAQTYTIKVKSHPAEGKSFSATETSKINAIVKLTAGDKVVNEDKKGENEEKQYTEKVLTAGDNRPTKFTRTYAKAARGKDGPLEKLSYAGKTIIFELKGDNYVATADDAGVMKKDLDDLAQEAGDPDLNQTMVPKNPVKVGDTWPLGKEAFATFLREFKDGADLTNLKAQGKLIKAYKKDGQQWGTIEIHVSVPLKKVGPLALDKPISFVAKLTVDTAIDGSTTAAQLKGTLTFKGVSDFTQNDMTFTLDIAVEGVLNRAQGDEK